MENRYTIEDYVHYLQGTMDPEAQAQFSKDLENSPEMQANLDEQKNLALTVQVAVLKNKLATAHVNYEATTAQKSSTRRFSLFQLAIAASFLVLISAGLWVWLGGTKGEYEQLYSQYYRADNGLPSLMDGFATPINDAMIDYKQKKYAVAAEKLARITANDTATYYLAASYAGLEKFAEANRILANIPQTSGFYEKALWYAALYNLKINDKAAAVQNLRLLSTIKDARYQSASQELLSALQ